MSGNNTKNAENPHKHGFKMKAGFSYGVGGSLVLEWDGN